MNYSNLNKILLILKRNIHPKKINLQILTDLLESEINDEEIIRLFSFDLKNERQIRQILNKSHYVRYQRIKEECDQRKALQIILYSMNFKKRVNDLLIKSLSYPILLFIFSLFVMIFVNHVLFSLFQSLLSFLGPVLNLSFYKTILNVLISFDIVVILICCLLWWLIKYHSTKVYAYLLEHFHFHFWQKFISREFCEKFIYFYQLGGNIELILLQIKWSSSQIVGHLCSQILNDLELGIDLSHSFVIIDSNLEAYFKMSMEGMDILKYLQNHNRIQEISLSHQIRKYSKFVLIYGYIVITLMIIIMYQIMLMPIQMMEELL